MITRELLRKWGACYSDEKIAELVPECGLTALEICDLGIPVDDLLWVVLREDVIPASHLRLLACQWARVALEAERAAGREPDPRSWAAVDVAAQFARDEATVTDLDAACDAAWAAARDAACAAAWAAARAAARDAQWSDCRAWIAAYKEKGNG